MTHILIRDPSMETTLLLFQIVLPQEKVSQLAWRRRDMQYHFSSSRRVEISLLRAKKGLHVENNKDWYLVGKRKQRK
jgi:hypothetical protein